MASSVAVIAHATLYVCDRPEAVGPRRPSYNPSSIPGMFFFHIFEKKCLFCSSYTISSIIVARETRLTENGILPELIMRMVSFIS